MGVPLIVSAKLAALQLGACVVVVVVVEVEVSVVVVVVVAVVVVVLVLPKERRSMLLHSTSWHPSPTGTRVTYVVADGYTVLDSMLVIVVGRAVTVFVLLIVMTACTLT